MLVIDGWGGHSRSFDVNDIEEHHGGYCHEGKAGRDAQAL